MHEQSQDDSSTPQIYQSKPQGWLRRLHATADLGYAGFFPLHPGQEEDILSVRSVKYGFATESRVSAEAFSAKAVVEGFHSDEVFSKLEGMMNELFERRVNSLPNIPASTFRLPTRVTLNESKRRAWFRDLANPDVPLHKLGKSVPHGAKGQDLLDLLHTNNVAIPRAVWFLRVFGANEVAGLRNKPSYNPTQYSIEWANTVANYMKKQLLDIALPSPPRAGLNIKQTFKGVLTDAETRERWISRFSYCLQLLRIFYAEGMVDKRTFLVWLVQQMSACNLAQAGFVARLADEYLTDLFESRALSRAFADASLNKLTEILSSSPAQACLHSTAALLRTLIQRTCLAMADAFISPRIWTLYSPLLCEVLIADTTIHAGGQHIEQRKAAIQNDILGNISVIEARNEELLLLGPVTPVPVQPGSSVSDIKLLNSISSKTNLQKMTFFDCDMDDTQAFTTKLDVLLTWSVTSLQYGHHRPFAAIALIDIWRTKQIERAHRRDLVSPHNFLQDQLFDWLDLSPASRAEGTIDSVALLYGNLIERDLFCYATYLQRLVARGEHGLSLAEDNGSHHRNFIRCIPLSNSKLSLVNQRKVLLYGVRAREVPEGSNERQIRKEIRGVLPRVFGLSSSESIILPDMLAPTCNTFMTSPRFEKVRTLKEWLMPILQNSLTSLQACSDTSEFLRIYAISIELMALARSFDCIINLIFALLQDATSTDVLMACVDYIYRYVDIWHCMDALQKLVVQLDATQQALKAQGYRSRLLINLLKLDGGRYLSPSALDRINSDIIHFTSALQPIASHPEPVPHILSEISRLEGDYDPDLPSRVADTLWIKYRASSEWGMIVWDNVLTSLHRTASGELTGEAERKYAIQYGTLLVRIDQHLPAGLDEEVSQWFCGPGLNHTADFNPKIWNMLSTVLIYLVANRALSITTILTGLVFPAWHRGATVAEELSPESSTVAYIQAANKLCWPLLLQWCFSEDGLPVDIRHVHCIESRQQAVYSDSFFPTLIAKIPVLNSMENNPCLPESLRSNVNQLRCKLCQEEAFRRAVYRNLDVTREAFQQPFVFSGSECDYDGNSFIKCLKEVLCHESEGAEGSQWLSSTHPFPTPWKLAATSIQLQIVLKELGRALDHQENRDHAMAYLDRISRELFHARMSLGEALYIREATRGSDDIITGKLIASGLGRVVEILLGATSSGAALSDCLSSASEVLDAVRHLTIPSNDTAQSIPGFDTSLHEHLIAAVHDKFIALDQIISSKYQQSVVLPPLVVLLRLLQFTLAFRGIWSDTAKDRGISLSPLLFRLTLKMCAGCDTEVSIFPILLDTLYYLLDEIPHDTKVPYDPFRYYPNFSQCDIPTDIAPEHRKQLMALSTQLSPNVVISDLVVSRRDSQGNFVHSTPVVNRPWEWVEYLGDPAVSNTKEHFRNSGSLSLELFGAKITGDSIIPNTIEGNMETNLKTFEDGLSAETLFRRHWRESHISDVDNSAAHVLGWKTTTEQDIEVAKGTVTGAPASMTPKSDRKSTGRQSPGRSSIVSDSTLSEIGDSESTSTASSKTMPNPKRKLDARSDDEIEVTDVPIQARPSSKKGIRIVGKGKARRR